MDTTDVSAAGGAAPGALFAPDTVVRFCGLSTAKYNCHHGTVAGARDMPMASYGDAVPGLRVHVTTCDGRVRSFPPQNLRPVWVLSEVYPCLRWGCAHPAVILRALQKRGLPPELARLVLGWLAIEPVRQADVRPLLCSSDNEPNGMYSFSMHALSTPDTEDCWISNPRLASQEENAGKAHSAGPPSADGPAACCWDAVPRLARALAEHGEELVLSEDETAARDPRSGALIIPRGRDPDNHEWIVYQLAARGCDVGAVAVHRLTLRIPPLPHGPLSVRRLHVVALGEGGPGRRTHTLETLDTDGLQTFALVPPLEARFVRVVFEENAAGEACDEGAIGLWELAFG